MNVLRPAQDSVFLDAGCGVGDHSARIARFGMRVVGVDVSEAILSDARERIAREGLEDRVSFQPERLERLSFPDAHFDFVYCRGVLMHVPDWERALGELCRVLKPGGKIAIGEGNTKALETQIVALARRISHRSSKQIETPGGLEFWSQKGGQPFVVRIANVACLERALAKHRCNVIERMATTFWDINRFPAGFIRDGIIAFNQFWFSFRLPALFSAGNAIIATKQP